MAMYGYVNIDYPRVLCRIMLEGVLEWIIPCLVALSSLCSSIDVPGESETEYRSRNPTPWYQRASQLAP